MALLLIDAIFELKLTDEKKIIDLYSNIFDLILLTC